MKQSKLCNSDILPSELSQRASLFNDLIINRKHDFQYLGTGGPLFGIYLKTIFLSIFTFGLYRFWGEVALTKIIYRSSSVGAKNFDYHATGKERCIAFFKGLGILAVIGLILFGLSLILTKMVGPINSQSIITFLFIALLIAAQPFIIIGKHSFKLSRTSWANVRFNYKGKFSDYYKIFFKDVLN